MKYKNILILVSIISLVIFSISCTKETTDDSIPTIYLTVLHKSDSSAVPDVTITQRDDDPFITADEFLGCTDQNGNVVIKTLRQLKIMYKCDEALWASYQKKEFYPVNKNPIISKLLNHVIDTVYLTKKPKLYVNFNKVNTYSNQDTILVYLPYFGKQYYKIYSPCNTIDGTTIQLGPPLSFNETYVIKWEINSTIFNDSIFTGNQEEVYYNLNY